MAPAAVAERLEQRTVTIAWQDQRLADALHRLADVDDIPMWLDRRVDPRQKVNLTLSEQSLAAGFEAAAAARGLGVAHRSGLVYVGPVETSRELSTLVSLATDSLEQAPADRRRQWLRSRKFQWPRLSQPRELLAELAAAMQTPVAGAEQIPHDLWRARDELTLAPVELAVLMLAGFDLTCRIDTHLRIVPITRPVRVVRSYPVRPSQRNAVVRRLTALPAGSARLQKNEVVLTGRSEEHATWLAHLFGSSEKKRSRPPRAAQRGEPVYALHLQNQPVGAVVDQLAARLKLQIRWQADENARNRRVSCEVKDATLDELLAAVLTPASLTAVRADKVVTVTPAP